MYGNLMDIDVRQGGLRDAHGWWLLAWPSLAPFFLRSFFLSFLPSFFLGWALHCIALRRPPAAVCAAAPHRLLDATAPLSYCNDAMHLFMR